MTTHVIATAGHVDHGKSTLVRALTGMEPDRWAEERRRGLTIDLGFAWTELPSGREVAFVDVPGHERFLANALAGLGPASAVCFVVAADEGWSVQSGDHRDAVAAFGIRHGVIAVTRADRAPERVDEVIARARDEFKNTGLRDAPAIAVSAIEGAGLDELRSALDEVLARMPTPDEDDRLRLWADRAFTVTGAGTIITGTLSAGTIRQGDRLRLVAHEQDRDVVVRGLQSRGEDQRRVRPVNRVAVNLRGVSADEVHRGDALVTVDAWPFTDVIDVRRTAGIAFEAAPEQVLVHIGTVAVAGHLRLFDGDHARLSLDRRLPLIVGDQLLLRDPGGRRVLGGVRVLDAEPPELRRRGDGRRRAAALASMGADGDAVGKVAHDGAVSVERLRRLAMVRDDRNPPDEVLVIGEWWVHRPSYDAWLQRLRSLVAEAYERDSLTPGVSQGEAREALGDPASRFLDRLIEDSGLTQQDGRIRKPGAANDLGAAEPAMVELENRLKTAPFTAPVADELAELELTERELGVAVRLGRLIRLADGIYLQPKSPALAMRELARLPQPFTTSQAREALGSTRRVVIPLLEHLDRKGWTRRVDDGHREVVR